MKPIAFFLYLAYTAPHDPLQAWAKDIAKYDGVYENTLILFCSDNGCEKVGSRKLQENIGSVGSYVSPGKDWSNVSNTPHRMHKTSSYNGGSRTPMILHWPMGIKYPGRFTDKFAHLSDVMPTLIELSGAPYPEIYEGTSGRMLYGDSFVDVLRDLPLKKRDPIFMNRDGNRYIIDGGYKLVTVDGKIWSLYNLEKEATEITDLSKQEPEKHRELLAKYKAWDAQLQK